MITLKDPRHMAGRPPGVITNQVLMTVSGAVIRRVERPADRFTMISNDFHRDMRLTFAARGLGGWLLSHADGFQITSTSIARQAGIGRDQVRRWLTELEHYGYLRRERARGDGGHLGGMVYEVRCTPFRSGPSDDKPRSDLRLGDQAQADQAPVNAHHKNTSSKNITSQEDNPSGGSASPDSPEAQEEPMPRTTASPEPALFDLPALDPQAETEERQGRERSPSQRIVAAFVDSHRQHHGVDPTRAEIGRVARDVKRLIGNPSTEAQLTAAATAMGQTPFANIAVQLKKIRRPAASMHKQQPHGAGVWEIGAAETARQVAEEIAADPELAAWLAGDAVSA